RAFGPEGELVQTARPAPRGVECRLDGCRKAQDGRAFHLGAGGHLHMLDAMPAGPEVPSLAGVERAVHPLPAREYLLDPAVTEGVNADLQAGAVAAVEELGELVVGQIRDAVPVRVHIGLRKRRRPCADRSVDRQVATDRS